MIELEIRGAPDSLKKAEARAVIHWMAREMDIDKYRIPVWIDLRFKKNLKKRNGYRGSAVWEDTNHRPREFSIEIDSGLSRRIAISTILHEMVHVKQYCKGQLKDYLKTYCIKKWNSREINILKIRYRDYPWEKEAYDWEKIYYRKWIEYNKKKHR